MTRVPYSKLRQAEREMLLRFPEAARVHAMWTPASSASDIHVEVWNRKGGANVLSWPPDRVTCSTNGPLELDCKHGLGTEGATSTAR